MSTLEVEKVPWGSTLDASTQILTRTYSSVPTTPCLLIIPSIITIGFVLNYDFLRKLRF